MHYEEKLNVKKHNRCIDKKKKIYWCDYYSFQNHVKHETRTICLPVDEFVAGRPTVSYFVWKKWCTGDCKNKMEKKCVRRARPCI